MRSPWVKESLLAALVLAVLSYAWTFSAVSSPNERTRLYLSLSLLEDGVLHIDGPMKRYGRVYDLARHDGHFYTDKAPGSSLLALPPLAVARAFREQRSVVELVNIVRTWLMLPMALLGFLLMRRLLGRFARRASTRDVVSLGYALATPCMHYGTAFYGHVLVSTLVLAALVCLAEAGLFHDQKPQLGWVVAAGASAGLLGLVEYQAIVLSLLLAVPVILSVGRVRALLAYALGGVPFALLLFAYNDAAFGGPFELSYHHLASKELTDLHGFGLAGATIPTWRAISGLLFSQHRGLVTTSPLMGIGIVGLFSLRRHVPRALWWCSVLAFAYFFLIVSSSSVWYGGWSYGPRLLIPIMPVLAVFAAFLVDHWLGRDRGLSWALLVASVVFGLACQLLLQVTMPELPPSTLRPLPDAVRVALEAELVAPNLACKLTARAPTNLLPLAAVAFALVLFVCLREPTKRGRLAAFAGVAIATLCLITLWREEPSTTPAQQRKWTKLLRGWSSGETSCAKDDET